MLKSLSMVALLTTLVAPPVAAQEGQRGQRARGARANDAAATGEMRPVDVMNILDGYAIVQAQEALQLNDTQYGPFVTRLKKLQETRRRNLAARHRIVQELRKLAGPQAEGDEASIRQQLKALREHDDRSAEELKKVYDGVDEVLDARQQARFRLFEERLELRKMDLLMRARQGAARRQEGRRP